MAKIRTGLALAVLVLPAAMCNPQLTLFEVPPTVWAGHDFTVSVWGQDMQATTAGVTGCVLQLPTGVTVTGYVTGLAIMTAVRDDPAVLSLFTAEPGYYLASFHSGVNNFAAGITVRLRAPATLPPGSQLKVAFVNWQPGWSTAQGNFALIGGNQAMPIAVTNEPPTLVEASSGLPDLYFAATGDVDGDGDDEIVGTAVTSVTWEVWTCHWNGAGWNSTSIPVSLPAGGGVCTPGDFDGDGHLDLAVAGLVLFGDGLGGWAQGPSLPLANAGIHYLAVRDVDRDGFDDIAITSSSGTAAVYRGAANRTFSSWSTGLPAVPSSTVSLFKDLPLLADVTGDGNIDLVTREIFSGGHGLLVFAGNGQGQWSASPTMPLQETLVDQIQAGCLSNCTTSSIILPSNSGGMMGIRVFTYLGSNLWSNTFHPLATGWASAVLLEDFDGDGLSDLVLQSEPSASTVGPRLRLFRTLPGPTFVEDANAGLSAFSQFPTMTSGDFNGDGWPDLAIAHDQGGGYAFHNTSLGAHPFGAGCVAGSLAPRVTPVGTPQLGNPAFAIELSGAQANTFGFCWFGFSNRMAYGSTALPFDLSAAGAPGCSVLVDPLASRALYVGAQGRATWPLPLPLDPAFHRTVIYGQGATLAPGANALGVLFSGGLAVRID